MKQILTIKLCLTILLFTSCHNTAKYENATLFSFKDFNTVTKLNATTIEFDEPFMLPVLFVKSDSLFIMQNIRTNNMVYVYNLNARKKVGEFISWGNGPNDLLRIQNMQLIGRDLYITDTQKRSISKYDVNDFHQLTNDLNPIQKVTISDFFLNAVYTDNGYVATGMNPENKRLLFYNSTGEKEFAAGEYPYFGEELASLEKFEGFNSSIAVSQQYKRIYLFGMMTDLIEIYDFQGILIKRVHGPEQFFPQVKEIHMEDGYSRISSRNSISAFFGPKIIDNEIYVSYSGKLQEIDNEVATIEHIFVFDMDCNPIRRYELPKPIASFTVDTETKKIYATCNKPEYHMVIFE